MVVDSPPGTGDEPLTVAQTIPDAEALIVTTPQEISLADVRKSINFCRQLDMNIIGIVENMSDFSCPHCGERIGLFGNGGGARMASQMGVNFLGEVHMDPEIVFMGDKGSLGNIMDMPDKGAYRAYDEIVKKII